MVRAKRVFILYFDKLIGGVNSTAALPPLNPSCYRFARLQFLHREGHAVTHKRGHNYHRVNYCIIKQSLYYVNCTVANKL